MEDKIFRYTIFVSFLIHVCFFVRFYMFKKDLPTPELGRQFTYQIERVEARPPLVEKDLLEKKIESIAPSDDIKAGVPQPLPNADTLLKDIPLHNESFKMYEREPEKVKGMKVTKEVSMPMLKSDKINTPSYVTYYQIVRDRIRDRAYTNYTRLSVGEVFLTFIIRADGTLGELQIMETKSTANDFLREVGEKSVREAAPFPPFPRDLNYPELTFNVAISFQYREE